MTNNIFSKITAEFIGTYALVLIGTATALLVREPLSIALAFGLTVTVFAFTFGQVSGAHFNPAVTVAMALLRKIKPIEGLLYIISQVLGAIAGSYTLLTLLNTLPGYKVDQVGLGANFMQSGFGTNIGMFAEALFTFFLVLVILGTTAKYANSKFAPIAIGLIITLAHIVLIPITGTSINPARSIAPAIFAPDRYVGASQQSQGTLTKNATLDELWIFVLFPIIGAILAALVQEFVIEGNFDKYKQMFKGTKKTMDESPEKMA